MNELVDLSAFDLAVGRNLLSAYFGPWAILPDRFEQLVQRANQLNIRSHIEQNRADYDPFAAAAAASGANSKDESNAPYAISQGIAQIEMIGPMMKFASSLSSNVSTVYARKQLRHAANNPDVKAIFLRIDSPGGTVSGTKDLADEIARTKAIKPVVAFVEDLAASAAYWVAAQATEIIANNTTALIGSIGTYAVIYDYSRSAENMGIKTHLITTGKFRGAGVPGVAITPEQLTEFQRVIDSLNDQFKSAVASGRTMATATIDELADGRVHPATLALDYKLIDRIESFDAAFSRYLTLTTTSPSQPSTRRSSAMSVETKTENHVEPAATLEQLEKVCSEPGFVMEQLKLTATVSQATIAYNSRLKAEREATKSNQAAEIISRHASHENDTGIQRSRN
jgi:signal peptide peptidase SppA